MKLQNLLLAASLLASGFLALPVQAQTPASADQLYDRIIQQDPYWKNDYTGEDFAWHTVGGMHRFLQTYESTKDTAYLDAGVKFFDALIARMATGPDGYKGFIGPYEYTPDGEKPKYWCDDHVGDALLFDGMLEFSFHVLRDPKLKEKYGEKALSYVNAAKRDFFEKWDSRGTYHQDGPFGFYTGWDQYCEPANLKVWAKHPDDKECAAQDNLSIPFNKDIDIGAVALRIWQCTGDEKYKHKAEQLFGYMKSRMSQYKGAMHWNYWEPTGLWDLGATEADMKKGEWNPAVAKDTMRHWIAVHPHRNYQENEMANIMKAYNAGIVFTEDDMKKIIQTQLKVMWNGDENKPLWANSNADLTGEVGKPEFYHPANTPEKAGTLWPELAQLDPTVRKLASRRRGDNGPPPSFDRKDVAGKIEIPEVYAQFPLANVRTIGMAAAMPSIFPLGQQSAIMCKLTEKGELEVALYSPDGKSKIATLKQGTMDGGSDGREGDCYFLFDGTLPDGKTLAPGNYRIRWTVTNDGSREFPITLEAKK